MAFTKTELKSYVRKEKERILNKLRAERDEAYKKELVENAQRIIDQTGLNIDRLEVQVKALFKDIDTLYNHFEDDDVFSAPYILERFHDSMKDLIEEGIMKSLTTDDDFYNPYETPATKNYKNSEKLIELQFKNIEKNITGMSIAKTVDYLKDLGFDFPVELDKDEETVLAKVDKDFIRKLRGSQNEA